MDAEQTKQLANAAQLFGECQVALRDSYASTPQAGRNSDFWDGVSRISENRKTAYTELMADPYIFEAMCSGGKITLGTFHLEAVLIQPGKVKESEKWLKQSPTNHYIKLKVGGVKDGYRNK